MGKERNGEITTYSLCDESHEEINNDINSDLNEFFAKKPFRCFGDYGNKAEIQIEAQKEITTSILLNHIPVDFFNLKKIKFLVG